MDCNPAAGPDASNVALESCLRTEKQTVISINWIGLSKVEELDVPILMRQCVIG